MVSRALVHIPAAGPAGLFLLLLIPVLLVAVSGILFLGWCRFPAGAAVVSALAVLARVGEAEPDGAAASVPAHGVDAEVRAVAVSAPTLVHVVARLALGVQGEAVGTATREAARRVGAGVGAAAVAHRALVPVPTSHVVILEAEANWARAAEAALRVLADVRAAGVLVLALVHVPAGGGVVLVEREALGAGAHGLAGRGDGAVVGAAAVLLAAAD